MPKTGSPMSKPTHFRLGRADVAARAERMEVVLASLKAAALLPESVKKPPRINLINVAGILGMSKSKFQRSKKTHNFPDGERSGSWSWYSIEQVQEMAKAVSVPHPYAKGHGIVVTVANFKGGVLKTSTTVTLAQYLSLRGYRCLVIDMDPQASATMLFGLSPYTEVTNEQSAYGMFGSDAESVNRAIRKTYWPGIDLIAANLQLYGVEFALAGDSNRSGGDVFTYFADMMPELRETYDVILVDTQPSLSFITANSLFGSDHLLVTVPPSALDFASSAGFWKLLKDVMASAENAAAAPKYWENISVLPTKVDHQDQLAQRIRQLLSHGCEGWLLSEAIPVTRVATNAAAGLQTVYDIERYDGSHRSMKSARESYDKAYDQVLAGLKHTWDVWQNPENWTIETTPVNQLLNTKPARETEPIRDAAA